MKKLAGMIGLVGVGYVGFTVASDARQEQIDDGILLYIASIYTVAVLVMLIHTRKWSTIGCGLLATMAGDALVYARASPLTVLDGASVLDLARSCFLVGGTYLIVGMVHWVRDQHPSREPRLVDGPA